MHVIYKNYNKKTGASAPAHFAYYMPASAILFYAENYVHDL